MPRRSKAETLAELLAELPDDLRRQAFTHASWVEHRAESYERLAFLGDVVLSLAVSTHLYPRFEHHGAGRLTKVRAQAVRSASRGAPRWSSTGRWTSWARRTTAASSRSPRSAGRNSAAGRVRRRRARSRRPG